MRVLQNLIDDLRVGLRVNTRDRYASLLMVGSLGLAIGAFAVVISLIDAVLFRPLPAVSDPSALFAVYGDDRSTAQTDYQSVAYPDYLDFKKCLEKLADLTVYARFPVTLSSGDEARRLTAEVVAPNYFSLLGASPLLGRAFEPQDDEKGAAPVAVISHRFWQTRFGSDPNLPGQLIRINGLEARIIGIAPADFGGILLDWHGRADIWLPLHLEPRLFRVDLLSLRIPWLMTLGRLLPGTSMEQVRVAVQARARDLETAYSDTHQNRSVVVLRAEQARFYPGRRKAVTSVLSLLFAGALILLLVACFNTAGLLLARGERRGAELSVRMALGAKRGRLVFQLIVESLIIAAAADLLAVLFAFVATRYLPSFAPMFHLDFETRLDERVVFVLLFVTLLTVLAFGLYPALRGSSVSLAHSLKNRAGGQASTFGVRRAVLVSQVGLTVVVMISAFLFFKELRRVRSIDPGFEIQGIQMLRLDAQAVPADQRDAVFLRLLHRARTLPGVQEACLAGQEPLSGGLRQTRVRSSAPGFDEKRVAMEEVSRDYFRLLRLPLLQGRTFESESDGREVVINEVMAARYWPQENPVGRRLFLGEEQTPYLVVGVCKASKTIDLTEQARPFLYIPRRTSSFPEIVLLTRSSLPLSDLVTSVRRQLQRDVRGVALLDSSTLERTLARRLSVERTLAVWALSIAALALVLVTSGLMGLLSLLVSQRSREMAIRLALGASPHHLSRWVMAQACVLAVAGLAVGFCLFFSLQTFLPAHLRAVGSSQLTTCVTVAGVVLATCLLACLGPAFRVLRAEPNQALRAE